MHVEIMLKQFHEKPHKPTAGLCQEIRNMRQQAREDTSAK